MFLTVLCSGQQEKASIKDKGSVYFGISRSFRSLKVFKMALKDYNEKRDWLQTRPEISNNMTGFTVGSGLFISNKSYYDFNLFYYNQKTKADGYSKYGYSSREFRIRDIGLGFDYLFTNSSLLNQIYIGSSLKISKLSFRSFSTFYKSWSVSGVNVIFAPKAQYIPSFLKKRGIIDFQFNLPLNLIEATDLKTQMGVKDTQEHIWPYSFDISLKLSLL